MEIIIDIPSDIVGYLNFYLQILSVDIYDIFDRNSHRYITGYRRIFRIYIYGYLQNHWCKIIVLPLRQIHPDHEV
jgi:hypothetical protein